MYLKENISPNNNIRKGGLLELYYQQVEQNKKLRGKNVTYTPAQQSVEISCTASTIEENDLANYLQKHGEKTVVVQPSSQALNAFKFIVFSNEEKRLCKYLFFINDEGKLQINSNFPHKNDVHHLLSLYQSEQKTKLHPDSRIEVLSRNQQGHVQPLPKNEKMYQTRKFALKNLVSEGDVGIVEKHLRKPQNYDKIIFSKSECPDFYRLSYFNFRTKEVVHREFINTPYGIRMGKPDGVGINHYYDYVPQSLVDLLDHLRLTGAEILIVS